MEEAIAQLVTYVGAIVLLAVAYGETFGPLQSDMTQAVVDAAKIKSRYRRATNYAVGILVALGIFAVLSVWVDVGWRIIPVGILAGITSSVKAGKVHDQISKGQVLPDERYEITDEPVAKPKGTPFTPE